MAILNFPDTTGKPTDGSFAYEENGVIYSWTGDYWAANNAQGFDQRYVNADGDTMTGDLTVPSLNGGPLAGLRNQLINSDFRIWQRGTTGSGGSPGTDATTYVADRWATRSRNDSYAITRQEFSPADRIGGAQYWHNCTATTTGANDSYVAIDQRIEDGIRILAGETYTLSFWALADGNKSISVECEYLTGTGGSPSAGVASIGVTKFNLTTTWTKYTTTISFPQFTGTLGTDNNSCVNLRFWLSAGSAYNGRTDTLGNQTIVLELANVQLEPGLVATPLEIRPIGLELQLSQRYFFKHDRRIVAYAYTNREYRFREYQFPTTMRAVPTLTFPTNFNWKVGTLSRTATIDGFEVEGWADDEAQTTYIEGLTADAEL